MLVIGHHGRVTSERPELALLPYVEIDFRGESGRAQGCLNRSAGMDCLMPILLQEIAELGEMTRPAGSSPSAIVEEVARLISLGVIRIAERLPPGHKLAFW